MIAHVTLAPAEDGAELIKAGATCAMKGQAANYWPADTLDDELRRLLKKEGAWHLAMSRP